MQITKLSSIFLKKLKFLTPVFGILGERVCFLQLFTKTPENGSNCIFPFPLCNKWLIQAILRCFRKKLKKADPLKWQNTVVKHFNFFANMLESLDISMLRFNLKRHPSVPRLIKKNFFYFWIHFAKFYHHRGLPVEKFDFCAKVGILTNRLI